MKPCIRIVWLDAEASRPTRGVDQFQQPVAEQLAASVAAAVDHFQKHRGQQAIWSYETVGSEEELFDLLDGHVLSEPTASRETMFWLLLPWRHIYSNGAQDLNYLSGLAMKPGRNYLLARLVTRYPLSWLVFHFSRSAAKQRAAEELTDLYAEDANDGYSTADRLAQVVDWHFHEERLTGDSGPPIPLELFLGGVRQWFDPLGFRATMLEVLLKDEDNPAASSPPRVAYPHLESRRRFLALAVDDERAFANCTAYAAYRAGFGSLVVSDNRVFTHHTILPAIIDACSPANKDGYSVLVLRDVDLRFVRNPNRYWLLREWPQQLSLRITQNGAVVVRAISAVAHNFQQTGTDLVNRARQGAGANRPPDAQSEARAMRLGELTLENGETTYIGTTKPLRSLIMHQDLASYVQPPHRLADVAQHDCPVPITKAAKATSFSEAALARSHAVPRLLHDNLDFLSELAHQLAQSGKVFDLTSAALVELVRFESLSNSNPLLVAECLENIHELEVRTEVLSPYFSVNPKLSSRFEELTQVYSVIMTSQRNRDLAPHLIQRILGKLKHIYQENGLADAADRIQFELLKRAVSWKNTLRWSREMHPFQSGGLKRLLAVFYTPLNSLILWLIANVLLYVYFLCKTGKCTFGEYVYMAFSGNYPAFMTGANSSVGGGVIFAANTVIFINILFVAIFTTSLFRMATRD